MKQWLPTLMILLAMAGGCKKASFESVDKKKDLPTENKGTGDITPANGDLIVTVPVSQLPVGGKTTQATATMKDGTKPPVTWTVSSSTGKDPGTIDSNGVYTSPMTGTDIYPVVITATVISDPSIHNSVPLVIVPVDGGANGILVTVPVPQLLIGGNKTTAVATLKDGTKNPAVTWTVYGDATKVLGTIDPDTGVYTSPLTGTDQFPVIIKAVLKSDPTIFGSVPLLIVPDSKGTTTLGLTVTIPVPLLYVGGNKTTAVATLKDGTKNPPVIWTVTPIAGKDVGSIVPSTGIYTSPATGTEQFQVEIVATLIANTAIKGSAPLMIVPQSKNKPELVVTVPVTELKIGSNKTTAVAKLKDGTLNPPVTWTVTADGKAAGTFGSIDANGVYTSPATGKDQFAVLITATLKSDTTVKGSTSLTIVPVAKPALIVTVPSPQIKIGGNKITATALLSDGTKNPPVLWSVTTSNGRDPGTIDQNGIYTSPKTGTEKYPVIITAVLIADSSIMSSVPLEVIPDDSVFARCTKANVIFPIVADVYSLSSNTLNLPTTWSNKVTTVCMDQYNVPERDFTDGFPDVPGLFEYFGLNTHTTINILTVGTYYFRLTSDDGSKMWIDNILVINNDGTHETTAKEAGVNFQAAGIHNLTLDYFQGPRYKISLVLEWKKPGDANYSVVPKTVFK